LEVEKRSSGALARTGIEFGLRILCKVENRCEKEQPEEKPECNLKSLIYAAVMKIGTSPLYSLRHFLGRACFDNWWCASGA